MLRQDSFCMDTLGHTFAGSVGMYACHSSGGNQVHYACFFQFKKNITV